MTETHRETVSETVYETVSETCPTPHHTTPHQVRAGQGSSDSVRSGWHLEADQAGVVAAALLTVRPDWRYDATRDALRHDPRPWRTVVAAALTCALDPQAHPKLIEHTTARRFEADQAPTPIPPPVHAVLAAIRALDEEPQQ